MQFESVDNNATYRLVLGGGRYDFYSMNAALHTFLVAASFWRKYGTGARFIATPNARYDW